MLQFVFLVIWWIRVFVITGSLLSYFVFAIGFTVYCLILTPVNLKSSFWPHLHPSLSCSWSARQRRWVFANLHHLPLSWTSMRRWGRWLSAARPAPCKSFALLARPPFFIISSRSHRLLISYGEHHLDFLGPLHLLDTRILSAASISLFLPPWASSSVLVTLATLPRSSTVPLVSNVRFLEVWASQCCHHVRRDAPPPSWWPPPVKQ